MWKSFVGAAAESRRSVMSLLREALRLRRSMGQIGVSEYIDFRLYLEDLTFEQKAAFGGWRAQAVLEEVLVDENSRFLSLDKITMYTLLQGYGLPIPALRAVYRSRRPQGIVNLASAEVLANYLAVPGNLPVYIKPSHGSYGRGNILAREVREGELILGDGSALNLGEFCRSLGDGKTLGWILQEPLSPHAGIAALCGDKISGLRIHTFLAPDGPRVLKAIFKINIGGEDSDNFRHGASGNMLAAVDDGTGEITRVVSGVGPNQASNLVHPRTGKALLGFRLPHWEEIKSLVCEAHLAFPGYLCPGWDVAICNNGPKILEVNFFGDMDLSQHAYRRGFLDADFMRLLKACGLEDCLTRTRRGLSALGQARRGDRYWPW